MRALFNLHVFVELVLLFAGRKDNLQLFTVILSSQVKKNIYLSPLHGLGIQTGFFLLAEIGRNQALELISIFLC